VELVADQTRPGGRNRRRGRCLRPVVLALALFTGALGTPALSEVPGTKIYLDRPGVYAVSLEHLREASGGTLTDAPIQALGLSHRGHPVPFWIETDPRFGPGGRLIFVAAMDLFQPSEPQETRPMAVLLLTSDPPAGTPTGPVPPPSAAGESIPRNLRARPAAAVERMLRLEQDVLRAPVTRGERPEVDSLWYWAMITQQSSSTHVVEVGPLTDRTTENDPEVEAVIRLLGWSLSNTPEGAFQHEVEVLWNGEKVGGDRWDGRQPREIRLHVPTELLRATPNRLQVKIPRRTLPESDDPLIDIAYVDRVEVRYRPAPPLVDAAAPLLLEAADKPRWLADATSPADSRLYSASGWSAERRDGAGWLLPATATATELWIIDEDGLRTPLALEPLTAGARALAADTDYVMLAPTALLPGTERLAAFHRRRGLRVATVDINAVYDAFGGGEQSPAAIRRFLNDLYERSGALRYVLLVGDADWFLAQDRTPYRHPEPSTRNRIPTWTFLSDYGPAASDHYFAMDPDNEALARFAVGRLPVIDAAELETMVTKILTHAKSPAPPGEPSILMLSDSSRGSLLRQERLLKALEGTEIALRFPANAPDEVTADAVLAAFAQQPDLVYFGGHGSRYLWQLGDPKNPQSDSFFDREDVLRLAAMDRWPIAVSVSCATAPFDHPNADSLGEVMVLEKSRGAIAFLGASASLSTPRTFGESLIRALLQAETLGDAIVAAKRSTSTARVSHLYNLLGDPALPLRSRGPRRLDP